MKSALFYSEAYKTIEEKVKTHLNRSLFDTTGNLDSPRAVGDLIQVELSDSFKDILGNYCTEYSPKFARRSMADLAFEDSDGYYYIVDVKTHRTDTVFNMPNLTSVERLATLYDDDQNYFVILMVKYALADGHLTAEEVTFVPIEFLSWSCLTIGALGW